MWGPGRRVGGGWVVVGNAVHTQRLAAGATAVNPDLAMQARQQGINCLAMCAGQCVHVSCCLHCYWTRLQEVFPGAADTTEGAAAGQYVCVCGGGGVSVTRLVVRLDMC